MPAKRLNIKWIICFLFILIFLPAALILYQMGRNKIIFKVNGKALSHDKISFIGPRKYDGEYTLNENGAFNFGWTLFTENKQLLCVLDDAVLDDAQGTRTVNAVVEIPVHGIQTYDFYDNKIIITKSHFDFGLFEYKQEIKQISLPDEIEIDGEKNEND